MSVDPMEFLASGLLVLQTLPPDVRARWRNELFLEIGRRGGLVDDGKLVDKAIARELFSEVVERATRSFAAELIESTRERVGEDEVERLEVKLGNSLRRMLDHIAAKWA